MPVTRLYKKISLSERVFDYTVAQLSAKLTLRDLMCSFNVGKCVDLKAGTWNLKAP